MRTQLPEFSHADYEALMLAFREAGYKLSCVSELTPTVELPTVFLRHDVDLHLERVDELAQLESQLGIAATYYVPLTQEFNPLSVGNQAILTRLVGLGHELGLHYDLMRYPSSFEAALERLEWEADALERISRSRVQSICMHQPYGGQEDWFRSGTRWLNPHDPELAEGLLYISDSCRAWRDASILDCLGTDPPQRVLLNTHPELWLDEHVPDRQQYLERVVVGNALRQTERYLREVVGPAWGGHPAAAAHDAREGV